MKFVQTGFCFGADATSPWPHLPALGDCASVVLFQKESRSFAERKTKDSMIHVLFFLVPFLSVYVL
jgi:hypothetical protein